MDFKKLVRVATPFEPLPSVAMSELVKAIKADTFNLRQDAKGKRYLHVVNTESGQMFTIGISPRISTDATGEDLIAEMIRDYSIYYAEAGTINPSTGEPYEHSWLTFGKKPESRAPIVTVSIEKLMKGVMRTTAAQ